MRMRFPDSFTCCMSIATAEFEAVAGRLKGGAAAMASVAQSSRPWTALRRYGFVAKSFREKRESLRQRARKTEESVFSTRRTVIVGGRGFLREIESIKNEDSIANEIKYSSPLEIVLYPDPVLRAKCKTIAVFDDNLKSLAEEMFDVMYRTNGCGLSAPQVGQSLRLMVWNATARPDEGEEIVLVNPEIVKTSKMKEVDEEGCLSFPGIYANVQRPVSVKVKAQDLKGKKITLQLRDFEARVFQHEFDHLQGILYHDRMTESVRNSIQSELEKLERKFAEKNTQ